MKHFEILGFQSKEDGQTKAFVKAYYDSDNCFTGEYFSNLPKYFFEHLPAEMYELLAAVGVEKENHEMGLTIVFNHLLAQEATRPFWLYPEDMDESGMILPEIIEGMGPNDVEFATATPYSMHHNPIEFRSAMFLLFLFYEDPYHKDYNISKEEFETALVAFDVQSTYIDFYDPKHSAYYSLEAVGNMKPYYLTQNGVLKFLIWKAV